MRSMHSSTEVEIRRANRKKLKTSSRRPKRCNKFDRRGKTLQNKSRNS